MLNPRVRVAWRAGQVFLFAWIAVNAVTARAGEPGDGGVFEAPQNLAVCQVGYGNTGRVRVSWSNPESFEAVEVFVDDGGSPAAVVDGAFGIAEVETSPGEHTLTVQGVVGEFTSDPETLNFESLQDSPVVNPASDLGCEFVLGAGGSLLITFQLGTDSWDVGEVRLGGRRGNVEFGPDAGADGDDRTAEISLEGERPQSVEVAFKNSDRYFSVAVDLSCPQLRPAFRRGDCNGDGNSDISDVILTLSHLFRGSSRWRCDDACDANDDGGINLSDPVMLLDYLFKAGVEPASPGPSACGIDPTADFLGGLCDGACPQPSGVTSGTTP